MTAATDLIVVGAGLAGLTIAWRATTAGLRVTVADGHPGEGASMAAAGRLAAVTEAHYGEEPLARLNVAAAERYPAFIEEVEAAAGCGVGYRRCGSLLVAVDADDRRALDEAHAFHERLGLQSRRLFATRCRDLEPLLAPGIGGGIHLEGDHQVDNRLLLDALLRIVPASGAEIRRQDVAEVIVGDGRTATGVRLADGTVLTAPRVVIAAGGWTARLAGIPRSAHVPVRPVKGQILRLRAGRDEPLPSSNIQGLVHGNIAYVVPRPDGTVVLGASVEERGFDARVTAGAMHQLLRDAYAFLPVIAEYELVETRASFRPATPDNAPVIGETSVSGLFVAGGYFRNGVLLAPLAADLLVTELVSGHVPEALTPFSPRRFATAAAGSAA